MSCNCNDYKRPCDNCLKDGLGWKISMPSDLYNAQVHVNNNLSSSQQMTETTKQSMYKTHFGRSFDSNSGYGGSRSSNHSSAYSGYNPIQSGSMVLQAGTNNIPQWKSGLYSFN